MEQALYLQWRPMSFDDMVGQEHITRTLRNALKSGRIRHAYLFSGPRGTGKTTTARLLAKAVNCLNDDPDARPCNQCSACVAVNEGRYLDLIEIDAATHTGVDDVRDLREKIAFTPGEGRYKIYIIDEVHRFSGSAFDALLKTLEEPPEHAIFVLATTEIDKVPPTIKSRCLQFEFRRLSVREMADRLELICETEGLKADRAALEMVARHGTGSARDSISLLDQIVTDTDAPITLELVQNVLGTAASAAVKGLVEAVLMGDSAEGLRIIHETMDAGTDPRQFGTQIIDHLRNVLLAQTAGADLIEASDDERSLYTHQASLIGRGALVRVVRAFNDAINNTKGGWQPQLSLELALVESVYSAHEIAEIPASAAAVGLTESGTRRGQQPSAVDDKSQDDPEPEASPPGTPPLIEAGVINAQWDTVLAALLRYNPTAPGVMREYHVHHVDGNAVFLATNNAIYYDRINPFPEKKRLIERALRDVFRQPLRVQIILIDGAGGIQAGEDAEAENDPLMNEINATGGKARRIQKSDKKQSD
jgi:DNA polymerase-3 subunit gamma/tau